MSIDERRRLELADAAKRALGDEAGITLMEMLPPVGWADVATKFDVSREVDALRSEMRSEFASVRSEMRSEFASVRSEMRVMEERIELKLDARFERGFRQVIVTMSSLLVGGFFATVVASLLR